MLELCLLKVFEKFSYITFENVHVAFGLSTLIVLWGPYNKEHITLPVYMFPQGWCMYNVNGTMSKKWWALI